MTPTHAAVKGQFACGIGAGPRAEEDAQTDDILGAAHAAQTGSSRSAPPRALALADMSGHVGREITRHFQ